MSAISFSEFVLYFFFYSCFGWLCEVIYCSILSKRLVNRGFLTGPYCPIYGFGSLLLLLFLLPFKLNVPVLFVASVVITSALEYASSWGLEKLFGIRWWDYSHYKIQLNGRICLLNSLLFGVLGVVMARLIQPHLASFVQAMQGELQMVIASLIIVVLLFDLMTTLNGLYKLEEKLKHIQATRAKLLQYNKEYQWFDVRDLAASTKKLQVIAESANDEALTAISNKFKENMEKDYAGLRILRSFPHMKHISLDESLTAVKKSFEQRKETVHTHVWMMIKNWVAKFSQKANSDAPSFATGMNGYKLFWIFFIACVVGFVCETIFCYVTKGYIESRQGLLYGPFSQVYGFGAVIIVFLLSKISDRNNHWLFIGSALLGGLFEFACSFLQETIFGTISWEYTQETLGIAGRTSLMYMLFWGIMGVGFMRLIYPHLSHFIERIPNRKGFVITWILIVLMCADMLVSSLAVSRWSKRSEGVPPGNPVEVFIDQKYPDAMMKDIYPNMVFVEQRSTP